MISTTNVLKRLTEFVMADGSAYANFENDVTAG